MVFKKSDSAAIHEIFQGEVVYKSPLFQRHYVWDNTQLDPLWSDIDTVLEESSSSRFLGALVLQAYQNRTASKPQAYWIIDGQQRLTTFYLLLVACAFYAEDLGDGELASDYVKAYLLGQQSNVRNEPKMLPTIPDFGQFKEILGFIDEHSPKSPGSEASEDEGTLIHTFLRHLEEIKKRILVDGTPNIGRLKTFLETITEKIEFVQINLAEHHDANEVFNRLNVAGQPLQTIDLVRNEVFSLLSEDPNEAETIYRNHWVDFEKSFDLGTSAAAKRNSISIRDGFFFPFALIHNSSVKKAEVFINLSLRWKGQIQNSTPIEAAKTIINDLKEYVPAYLALSVGDRINHVSDKAWGVILRLSRMSTLTTLYPYTMKLLYEFDKERVNEKCLVSCIKVIESFLVRRAFIGLEPTGLHAVFKDLWNRAGADPDKVMKSIQTRTVEFPDDVRFNENITSSDLYHRRLCKYVLAEYERSHTRGDVLETFPDITIDHVMPQSRKGDWQDVISEDEHEKLIHTWANLAPLSSKANAEKGTKSWEKSREYLRTESVFKTTKKIADQYVVWNADTIKERSKSLSKWAINRWPK